MICVDFYNNHIDKAKFKSQCRKKPEYHEMGPFQQRFKDLNITPKTAGPHGEFSRSVKDWVETLAKPLADSKRNEDTLP